MIQILKNYIKNHSFISMNIITLGLIFIVGLFSLIFNIMEDANQVVDVHSVQEETPVSFSNPYFAHELAKYLDCEYSELTQEKLESVTHFVVINNLKLSSIEDLSLLPNLEQISLVGCAIEDISVLSSLKELKMINLADNSISDITPLYDLENIETLLLSKNQIDDISFSQMNSAAVLKKIDLSDNDIDDISNIDLLNSLEEFMANNNSISTVPALPESIVELELEENNISNITDLSKYKSLKVLNLADNKINHLEFVTNHVTLKELDISYNSISNIDVLEGLQKLEVLYLYGYNEMDLSPLSNVETFNSIYLSETFDRKQVDFLINNFKNADKFTKAYLISSARCIEGNE